MDAPLEAVVHRFEGIEHRLDALDDKVSRHFTWLVGIEVDLCCDGGRAPRGG